MECCEYVSRFLDSSEEFKNVSVEILSLMDVLVLGPVL
jgi:hypothetical protein